ncbi:MAG: hypothetical protein WCJ52_11795 [Phenylobacterium sp.]|uniref:hypothetical protein n=1 Tax=Phenylobacterium sp. TaxID=1871053 RepID=UPI003015F32A
MGLLRIEDEAETAAFVVEALRLRGHAVQTVVDGRMIKLAGRAPAGLEKRLPQGCPLAVSLKDLAAIADLPWAEQVAAAPVATGA